MTAFDVISFVWGAICQQSTHLIIPTISGRFIVITVFLSTLATFTSYSASIVALLQSPSHMIETIDDLLASPLKLALQDTGYNRYSYLVDNISVLQMVYTKKVKEMGTDGWVNVHFIQINSIFITENDRSSSYDKCDEIKIQFDPKIKFKSIRN